MLEMKQIKITDDAHLSLWREYIGKSNNKAGTLQEFSTKILLLGLQAFSQKESIKATP